MIDLGGGEHRGHGVDREADRAPLDGNEDPLRPPIDAGLEPKSAPHVEHGHHLAPVIGHTDDCAWGVRHREHRERTDDLANPENVERVVDVTDEKTDEVLVDPGRTTTTLTNSTRHVRSIT
jgi:hypothetical protein